MESKKNLVRTKAKKTITVYGKEVTGTIVTAILSDGMKYEGQWDFTNNCPDGQGIITFNGVTIYEGGFKKGVKHGKGIIKDSYGATYEGDFVNGKWEGYGKFYRTGWGPCYVGQWKNNRPHGKGILYDNKGNIQTKGHWINGELHEGIRYNEDGSVKEQGMFVNGVLQQNNIENQNQINLGTANNKNQKLGQ